MPLTLRRDKGGPLTHKEVDDNFDFLFQRILLLATPEQLQDAIDNAIAADNSRDDAAYQPTNLDLGTFN